MNILIPIKNDSISLLNNIEKWVLVELNDGSDYKINFYNLDKFDELLNIVDVVIVKSNSENVWTFMERNIAVLVAPFQESIDEVIEAFLFKELHDLTI